MASGHGHNEDEFVPLRTTPQGTQAEGVEYGHEEKDLNLRAVLGWFAALGAIVVVVVLLLWGVFTLWTNSGSEKEALPSEVFRRPTVYPLPVILPNPPGPGAETLPAALGHSPEALESERKREWDAAKSFGLLNAEGKFTVPEAAAQKVIADQQRPRPVGISQMEPVAGTIGTAMPLPSRASGGTRLENGLQ